eukprot:TRINITY_DN277_c0_g4_i1.p1 TRINITY_DN277_c0_g4~~TRINITY_DN277_c0_g4_i1.p1  ORF type:complete len:691 (-),score=161.30 TRINITY_DN277_c0_g4_i1:216-2288(-)
MGNTTSEHLITAITENKVEDVKKLLSPPHKVSANSKDFFECSALLHACGAVDRRLRLGCVEALIQHGADPHALHPSTGLSAIHYAARIADPRLLRVLLLTRPSPISNSGSEVKLAPPPVDLNIRTRDAHRNTPLHLAAARPVPSVAVIRLLLRHGADPLLANKHNALPALSEDLLIRIREMPDDPADELCALNPLDAETAFIPDDGLDDPDLHDFFPALPHAESVANSLTKAHKSTLEKTDDVHSIQSSTPVKVSAAGKDRPHTKAIDHDGGESRRDGNDLQLTQDENFVGIIADERDQMDSEEIGGVEDAQSTDKQSTDQRKSLLDEVNRQFAMSDEPATTSQTSRTQQGGQVYELHDKQHDEHPDANRESNQAFSDDSLTHELTPEAVQDDDSDLEDYIKDAFLISAPSKPKPAFLSDDTVVQSSSSHAKQYLPSANTHFPHPQPIPAASKSVKYTNDRESNQSEGFTVVVGGGEASHHPSKSVDGNSLMQRSRTSAGASNAQIDEVDLFQKEIEEFQREMDELRSKGYSVGQVVAVKPLDIEESEPVTLSMPLVDGAEETDVPRIITSALPISKESSERIHKNLSMFQANYALVVIVLLFFCALLNPILALAVLFLSAMWYWVMNQQRRTVPLGRSSGQQTLKNVAVVVATAIALLFFAADPMIFWLVTGVFSVVAIHAFIYVPLDR